MCHLAKQGVDNKFEYVFVVKNYELKWDDFDWWINL